MVSLALMKVRAKVAAKEYRRGLFSDSPPMKGLPFKFTTNTLTCGDTSIHYIRVGWGGVGLGGVGWG